MTICFKRGLDYPTLFFNQP